MPPFLVSFKAFWLISVTGKAKLEEQKTINAVKNNATQQTSTPAAPAGEQKRKNKKRNKGGKKDKSLEPSGDGEDMDVDSVREINYAHPIYCRSCICIHVW